jgi:hypothetical protein
MATATTTAHMSVMSILFILLKATHPEHQTASKIITETLILGLGLQTLIQTVMEDSVMDTRATSVLQSPWRMVYRGIRYMGVAENNDNYMVVVSSILAVGVCVTEIIWERVFHPMLCS